MLQERYFNVRAALKSLWRLSRQVLYYMLSYMLYQKRRSAHGFYSSLAEIFLKRKMRRLRTMRKRVLRSGANQRFAREIYEEP